MRVSEIREHLAKWEAASDAVSRNKSYTVDGLVYTRQDAAQIREMIDYWTRRLAGALGITSGVSMQQTRLRDFGQWRWPCHNHGGRSDEH